MKYWLIVGLKDSKFAQPIAAYIQRMVGGLEFEIVVVETGEGIGAWGKIANSGAILRCEEPGVVPFLNKALKYIRTHGDPADWVVRLDADDYYGQYYLSNIDNVRRRGADATGLPDVFVRTEEDRLFFCEGKNAARAGVVGGTIAGRLGCFLNFRSDEAWGEDQNWCQDMHAAHVKIHPREPNSYAMWRHEGHAHTWPVRGEEIVHIWPCDAYDLGDWMALKVDWGQIDGALVKPDPRMCIAAVQRLKGKLGQP